MNLGLTHSLLALAEKENIDKPIIIKKKGLFKIQLSPDKYYYTIALYKISMFSSIIHGTTDDPTVKKLHNFFAKKTPPQIVDEGALIKFPTSLYILTEKGSKTSYAALTPAHSPPKHPP